MLANYKKPHSYFFFTLTSMMLLIVSFISAQDWPKEIYKGDAVITIYQPQIESLSGNDIESYSAVSVKLSKNDAPVFGAVWISASILSDSDTRNIILENVKVTQIKFPEAEETDITKLKNILESEVPSWEFDITMEDLVAALDDEQLTSSSNKNFNTAPPKIFYRTTPSILVFIDGDPIVQKVENTSVERIVNTPFFIAKDPDSGNYFLRGGWKWYTSSRITEGWKINRDPPKELVQISDDMMESESEESGDDNSSPPEIIVSTEPAELILIDGEPDLKPIQGTALLYVDNTASNILFEINTQTYYILISGRWYFSQSLDKGWTFIESSKLPADFANIPTESDQADVLVSVAGTDASKEGLLAAQIPETAEVSREEASVEVSYDGDPNFENIEETNLKYAVNTDKPVILYQNKYYCCDNAVWFISSSAKGPWEVCVTVPDEIYEIPASNPVYNVTYVRVYDYSPSVVYVGYTPGYYGTYIYGPTIIYGTGWYYRPWYRYHYYPRPVTYGFGVHYNRYTGWNYSFGMRYGGPHGWFSVSFGSPVYRGYWGPRGYPAGYRHGYNRGYGQGYRAGYYAGKRAGSNVTINNNIYKNRKTGVVRTGDRTYNRNVSTRVANRDINTKTQRVAQPKTRDNRAAVNRRNNVYADKQGNVYRQSDKGWEKRDKGNWKPDNSVKNNKADRINSNVQKQSQIRNKSNQTKQKRSNTVKPRQNTQRKSTPKKNTPKRSSTQRRKK